MTRKIVAPTPETLADLIEAALAPTTPRENRLVWLRLARERAIDGLGRSLRDAEAFTELRDRIARALTETAHD